MLKRYLYLNGLAILAVVLHHANGWAFTAMIFWTDRYRMVTVPNFDQIGSMNYYVMRLLSGLIAFAIPTFLFVSGFFMSFATGQNQSTVSWKIVLARIKYLVIPYLFWCFIAILGDLLEGNTYSPLIYLREIGTGGIRGPYYFVPLLTQFYILSPFLIPFAKSHWKSLLFVAVLIQLFTQILLYAEMFQINIPFLPFDMLPKWFFPTRIFWFTLGIVVGFHLQPFKLWLARVKWLMLALTIIFLVLTILEREFIFKSNVDIPVETTINSLFAVCFILAFLGFVNVSLPLTSQLNQIGSKSFGIYLSHVPVQTYMARIIYHVAPRLLGYQVLFLLILFIVGLGIPLLLMEVVRRSPASRQYQYIFG